MVRIPVMKKDAPALLQLAATALKRAGANDRMAEAAARHLVRAEEQGLPTHGMSRVPFYCSMLRKGRADGAASPALLTDRGGACLIDNRDGLPYVSVEWAVEEAIQRARRNGIGFAGVRNSAHVGVLGSHLLPVAQAPLAGAAIGPEADSFFSDEGNRPRIGQAFIAIDPGALAGMDRYLERVETIVATMQADPEVRLPGARRFASEKSARSQGIEVPDELLVQIEKLAAA